MAIIYDTFEEFVRDLNRLGMKGWYASTVTKGSKYNVYWLETTNCKCKDCKRGYK